MLYRFYINESDLHCLERSFLLTRIFRILENEDQRKPVS